MNGWARRPQCLQSGRKGVADVAHQLLLAAGKSLGIKIDLLIGTARRASGFRL